jgi:hypothetical protein
MTTKTKGSDYIIWQVEPEDGVSEKPILIECYSDIVSITQEDSSINLNYESIDELCKLLKEIKKRQP